VFFAQLIHLLFFFNRPGSVIALFRIIFPTLVDSPLQALQDEIADNKLGNFTVDSKSLSFTFDGNIEFFYLLNYSLVFSSFQL
jgi:hypothetical protein